MAADVLARRGIATSLRTVAAELGTTSRMMVHYFGSRDQLVAAILVREEARVLVQCERLSDAASLRRGLLEMWDQLSVPDVTTVKVRFIAQIIGGACSRDSVYAEFAARLTDGMVEILQTRLAASAGISADIAAFRARATIAALQGLVAQRITSEDPLAIDAAFRRFVDVFVVAPESSPSAVRVAQALQEPVGERLRQPRLR